jgi:acetylornithine deacetylase/succinyl-diaminopimelate desuccinylase-like protein
VLGALLRHKIYSPFERKRRAAARVALYGSLALLILGAVLGADFLRRRMLVPRQAWMDIDWGALPEVQLLQRYIQIDTSYTTGDEVAGARFLAEQLAAAGIPSHLERMGERQANLWAVLEGEDPQALVLHSHIDTDPVENPEQWIFPPWSGQVEAPWIYGRGVFDMKSVTIAQLRAFIALKGSGRPLRRSVIFLATGSEEHGSDLGMRWVLREHPELVRRFWAVLTEGGIVEARNPQDIKYWGTEIAQRRPVLAVLCSADRARLEELRADLVERGLTSPAPRLTPPVETLLRVYGPTRDIAHFRQVLTDAENLGADSWAWRNAPQYAQEMLSNRMLAEPVEADPGGGYRLRLTLLLLPGVELEEAAAELLPEALRIGLPIVFEEPSAPTLGSSPDHPVFREIQALLGESYSSAPRGPWVLWSSTTDARFLRPQRIPAFGFTPFPVLSTDPIHIGESNERLGLPSFTEGVALYQRLVTRLVL